MVVLVTGGSGFIGSHIIDKLIEYNHTVRVLDKKKPLRDDLQFVQGSITDKEAISFAMKDVDVIYHLAAASNIDLVKDNPSQTIEYNVLATAYLLDEARIKKIKRFILASSVMVYEMKGHIYTFSKYASEQLCINFQLLYDLPFTILRIGTVYGPRNRRADVVSIFIENALRKNDLYINGTGEQTRNFIYVEDLADGAISALSVKAKNKILTLAGLQSIRIYDLAKIIYEIFDYKINIKFDHGKQRQDDYKGKITGIDETFKILKWQPKVDLKEGIQKTIDWYNNSINF